MTTENDTVMRLPLSGLCQFHRDDTGALRLMDSSEGPVFLIETSRTLPETAQDCDTSVLAVRASGDGLMASTAPARVAMCLPALWDDAMFLGQF